MFRLGLGIQRCFSADILSTPTVLKGLEQLHNLVGAVLRIPREEAVHLLYLTLDRGIRRVIEYFASFAVALLLSYLILQIR
jgi:hypothetical protein